MSSQATQTGRPTEWATPMIMPGTDQTVVYASFVSATHISSKTRQEVFVVTCAPSQCEDEVPKQTITQQVEMIVCPGDNVNCPEDMEGGPTMTQFGYPLGWKGDVTADGTTTEWELKMSMIRDNERSAGNTEDDKVTWTATTKVGKDVKATTSIEDNLDGGCLLYDHYAFVSVTAGVKELLKDYPDDLFPVESLDDEEFKTFIEGQRSVCAAKTSGASTAASNAPATATTGSESKETGSKESGSEDEDEDSGSSMGKKMSLTAVLTGALAMFAIVLV